MTLSIIIVTVIALLAIMVTLRKMHVTISQLTQTAKNLYRYFITGDFINALVHRMIGTGGNVADSALLLAVVYVTSDSIAPQLIKWILISDNVIKTLNQISVMAFSVLPELIIFAAVKITIDHWCMFVNTKKKLTLLWALLYTLPTLIFGIMTLITICNVLLIWSTTGIVTLPPISGVNLVIRGLAGWFYATLQMIFKSKGKDTYMAIFSTLKSAIFDRDNIIAERDSTIAERKSTIEKLEGDIASLEDKLANMQVELQETRLQLATKRIANRKNTMALSKPTLSLVQNSNNDMSEYDASDNGESITVTGNGLTVVATGEKRQRIKENIMAVIQNGGKINMKEIAKNANVSYNTARKYGETIIQEITQELPRIAASK